MLLSDRDIKSELESGDLVLGDISPDSPFIQPSSVDLRLGGDEDLFIWPGKLVLADTLEYVKIPPHLAARVEGKSTWGRRGLMVHLTAGWIDPGFEGTITLEMYYVGPMAITIKKGAPICQLSIFQLKNPCERPYGHPSRQSKYQGQTGPTKPR